MEDIYNSNSIGRNTTELSFQDQLKKYKVKSIEVPSKTNYYGYDLNDHSNNNSRKYKNPAHESLKSKTITIIIENYFRNPINLVEMKDNGQHRFYLPIDVINDIITGLPLPDSKLLPSGLSSKTLSPIIAIKYVHQESYWKRAALTKFGIAKANIHHHNSSWKQLYAELFLAQILEDSDPESSDISLLIEFVQELQDLVHTITLTQLPSHLDLGEICCKLPMLSKLDLTYGRNNVGMNFERNMFGIKITDASYLAKIFESSWNPYLVTVVLSGNMIDDDLLRILMTGLLNNRTIMNLDLSHNKITSYGANLISKLLGFRRENNHDTDSFSSILTRLNLANNLIDEIGGKYLGTALKDNDSLVYLNLRLNQLQDEGCAYLMNGLSENISLQELNLSCNSCGEKTGKLLLNYLRDPHHPLTILNISGNELDKTFFQFLVSTLETNKHLRSIDLRGNPGYDLSPADIADIESIVYQNELNQYDKLYSRK